MFIRSLYIKNNSKALHKFLLILVLFCSGLYAQDSVSTVSGSDHATEARAKYTAKGVQADTSRVAVIEFDKGFKQRYRSEDFDYEAKPLGKTVFDRFMEWLGNLLRNLFSMGGAESLTAATWIFRIVCALILLFVIYLIVKAILNKEGQWVFGRSSANRIYGANELEKNLQQADFEKLVLQTMAAGDKRLAIRYYYLWLLQRFSKKGIIEWDLEKTNSDYVYEIGSEKHRSDFAYLSYLYNYVWYGEFETDDETFAKATRAFEKTIQSV